MEGEKKKNRRESDQHEAAAGLLADGQKCGDAIRDAPLFAGWMSRVGGGGGRWGGEGENAITAAIITQIRLPAVPLPAA